MGGGGVTASEFVYSSSSESASATGSSGATLRESWARTSASTSGGSATPRARSAGRVARTASMAVTARSAAALRIAWLEGPGSGQGSGPGPGLGVSGAAPRLDLVLRGRRRHRTQGAQREVQQHGAPARGAAARRTGTAAARPARRGSAAALAPRCGRAAGPRSGRRRAHRGSGILLQPPDRARDQIVRARAPVLMAVPLCSLGGDEQCPGSEAAR
eukprot:scaffold67479_cov53-Phaeocystis_antarctica.AAC.3